MHRLHLHGLAAAILTTAASALLIPSTQSLPEFEADGIQLATYLASKQKFSLSPVCSDCSFPGRTLEESDSPSWLDIELSVSSYTSKVLINTAPLARLEDLQDYREPSWTGFSVTQRTKDEIAHRTMSGKVTVSNITPFPEGQVIECNVQIFGVDDEQVNVEVIKLTLASTPQGLAIYDARVLGDSNQEAQLESPFVEFETTPEDFENMIFDNPYVPVPGIEVEMENPSEEHDSHQGDEADGHLRAHDHIISLNCPEDSSFYAAICRMRAAVIHKFGGLVQPPSTRKHGCHKNIKDVIHGGPDKFRRPLEQFEDDVKITDDDISSLYGSHGGARPHHTKHHRVHHIGDDFEHRVQGYTQSVVHILRRVVVGIVVPILVGIAAGMTASLLGMVVGTLIASVWVFVVRRGRRGNASERQRTMEAQVGLNDTDDVLEPGEADGLLVVEKEDVVVPVAVSRAPENASELDGSEAPPAYVEKE